MSQISNRGTQLTSSELAVLTQLTSLSVSGAGEFIRKISATTFENATPETGGESSTVVIESAVETTNGVRTTFTFEHSPLVLLADNSIYLAGAGFTVTGAGPYVVEMSNAPVDDNAFKSLYNS